MIELVKTNANEIIWKILVQEMSERMKNKAITQWTIRYHQKMEKLLVQSNLESVDILELKQKIKALYEEQKPIWEKYLDPSGSGS